MSAPLVIADIEIGQLIGLAVVVISFLSWFVKQLKGGDAPGGQAPPARPPADKPLRSEIEVFLKELTKGEEPKRRPQQPPQRKPAPAKAKTEKARKPRPPEPAPQSGSRKRPGSQLEQKHLATSQLGQGLRSHLNEYMTQDRVTAEAQQFIGDRVDQAVEKDLGQMTAAAIPRSKSQHPLLALLAQPGGVRQALIMNELLQKPTALRKKKSL